MNEVEGRKRRRDGRRAVSVRALGSRPWERLLPNSGISQQSGTANTLFGVSFLDAETGMVVGAAGTILRTDDGG
ncbi:MAG TPA: hypothetical protein VF947_04630 [Myxococcales bacterium]